MRFGGFGCLRGDRFRSSLRGGFGFRRGGGCLFACGSLWSGCGFFRRRGWSFPPFGCGFCWRFRSRSRFCSGCLGCSLGSHFCFSWSFCCWLLRGGFGRWRGGSFRSLGNGCLDHFFNRRLCGRLFGNSLWRGLLRGRNGLDRSFFRWRRLDRSRHRLGFYGVGIGCYWNRENRIELANSALDGFHGFEVRRRLDARSNVFVQSLELGQDIGRHLFFLFLRILRISFRFACA